MKPKPHLPVPEVVRRLRQLTSAPREASAFDGWLHQREVLDFVDKSSDEDDVILYAHMRGVFIHGVFVPRVSVEPFDREDLADWDCNPYDSWGIRNDGSVTPPLSDSRSKTLADGEQVVFGRTFEGVPKYGSYIEISQKFIHVLNLHYLKERSAWCRLDRHGDIQSVVSIVAIEEQTPHPTGEIVLANRGALAEYLNPQDLMLLRMFEFQLYRETSYPLHWSNNLESQRISIGKSVHARLSIDSGYASFSRGSHVTFIANEEVDYLYTKDEYETFIAYDVKSRTTRRVSCSPKALGNYFSPSPLPYEISPVFFRPEVLLEYKRHGEKYTFDERSISCRGSWSLKTYDINEKGQVHTYLKYLGQLPHEEQLHWKKYNEPPKAPISRRAYETDIKGNFRYKEDNPLAELKIFLCNLHCAWWAIPHEDMMRKVQYPYTMLVEEWKDDILALYQLLIEGLKESWIRTKAEQVNSSTDPKARSIGLLRAYLVGVGVDEESAKSIVSPLHLLREHRNKLSAHVTQESGSRLQDDAISNFGSYRQHYTHIVKECLATFQHLDKIFVAASKGNRLDGTPGDTSLLNNDNQADHQPTNTSLTKKQTDTRATQEYEYDVALSFAGSDREYAQELYNALRAEDISVFYDRANKASMWGKDLATTLPDVYEKQARYCVIFVSREYRDREWTTHELRSALTRAVNERGAEYILPIRIDNIELDGLSSSIHYLSIDEGIDQIAKILIDKIRVFKKTSAGETRA